MRGPNESRPIHNNAAFDVYSMPGGTQRAKTAIRKLAALLAALSIVIIAFVIAAI